MRIRRLICYLTVLLQVIGCVLLQPPDYTREHRASALIDQGVAFLRQGQFERARASFKLSRELYPTPAASDGLGCVAFMLDQNELAEQYFKEALESDFSYTEARGNLALLYEQTGRSELAREAYEDALADDPANYRVRNNYAVFLTLNRLRSPDEIREVLIQASLLEDTPVIENNMRKILEAGR